MAATSSAIQPVNPRACSLAEAERWTGVSRQTLAKWLDRGAPCVQRPEGRGKPALVSVPDLMAWKIKVEVEAAEVALRKELDVSSDPDNPERMSKEEADRRFAVARAVREEGRALEQFGKIVRVEDVAGAVARRLSSVRQILLGLYREVPEVLLRKVGVAVQASSPVLREILDAALKEMNEQIKYGAPENKDIEHDDDAPDLKD